MFVGRSQRRWLGLLAILPLAGCATLQDAHYEHTQGLRTHMAYFHFWWCSGDGGSSDYAKGWRAGYRDVITGGDGCPPLVAPSCYWAPSQILDHCDQKRQEWYVGFQDGAVMASLEPDTHHIRLWNPPPSYAAAAVYEVGPTPTGEPPLAPAAEAPPAMPTPAQSLPMPDELPAPPGSQLLPPSPPTPEQIPN
jgi:hypothetical protein